MQAPSARARSRRIDRAEAALNHRFNRLSVQFRGSVADYAYGDTQNLGVATDNADRDYRQTEEAVRGDVGNSSRRCRYSLKSPSTSATMIRGRNRSISRSSDGERYRVGVSFGNTGQILRGEVSIGYGVQTPDDARLERHRWLYFGCQRDVAGERTDVGSVQRALRCQ